MSVDVEQLFSCGRLLLSHVRSGLLAQTMCALLYVGLWSPLDLIRLEDIKAVASLPTVDGEDMEMADGWDTI